MKLRSVRTLASRATDSLRSAGRSLVRAPSFSITAILTLAMGLGLSIAVFSVADALLLRKLPMADQDRLVALWGEMRDHSLDNVPLGLSDTREFIRRTTALQSVAYFEYEGAWPTVVVDGARTLRLRRALVSGNLFDVLGTRAVLGRSISASDDVVGAGPAAVISNSTWRGLFGGDPDIVGKRLASGETGAIYTIVGVMPPGLEYPTGTDLWLPITPLSTVHDSTYALVNLVGRLAPAATVTSAQAELTAFLSRRDAPRATGNVQAVGRLLPRVILGDARAAVFIFATASALLLFITCMNVANLLLVRGLARAREMAIRAALGASRSRLTLHLLAENSILALVGGAVGVALAAVGVKTLVALAPAEIPRLSGARVDPHVLVGAVVIAAAATLMFGVAPAFATARDDSRETLRSGMRQSASRRSRRAREILVAAQVALAVLILSAAGLIGRSLMKLENADLRIDDSHLLIAELGIRYDMYDDATKQVALMNQVLPAVRALPGVRAASPVLTVPFSGAGGWDAQAPIDGQSAGDAARNPMFNLELVTPDYFATLGLTVLRGRPLMLSDQKGTDPVVVVSASMARRYWPDRDPIGQRLRMGTRAERAVTVVGVVPDTRYRDLREARASAYFPLAQSAFSFSPNTVLVRTSDAPAAVIPALRRAIAGSAPGVLLTNAASFQTYEAAPLAQPRLDAFLLMIFALAAVALAGIGLFAIMMTLVRQRTRELAVRMALGATAGDVQRLVMGRGLVVAGGGVIIGLTGALLTNRLLSALLFEVSPTDVTTLFGVGALLAFVALVATFVPARISTRTAPAVALGSDA